MTSVYVVRAFNPSLRNSGQPQRSAQEPTPDLSQYLGQGCWLEIDPTFMFCGWKKPEQPEETHCNTGRTCKLYTEGPCEPGIEPRTFCYEATVLTTVPPCHPIHRHEDSGKTPARRFSDSAGLKQCCMCWCCCKWTAGQPLTLLVIWGRRTLLPPRMITVVSGPNSSRNSPRGSVHWGVLEN